MRQGQRPTSTPAHRSNSSLVRTSGRLTRQKAQHAGRPTAFAQKSSRKDRSRAAAAVPATHRSNSSLVRTSGRLTRQKAQQEVRPAAFAQRSLRKIVRVILWQGQPPTSTPAHRPNSSLVRTSGRLTRQKAQQEGKLTPFAQRPFAQRPFAQRSSCKDRSRAAAAGPAARAPADLSPAPAAVPTWR